MDASTELFDAIRAGDVTRVRALVTADRGIVNRRNDHGHSPVLIAQYHHQPEVVAVLLAAGPDLDIFDASSVGVTARVAEWLERDPKLVNAYSGDGFYPLGLAAFFGHLETVRLLLARGADVKQTARNPMKVQALHAGLAGNHREIARALLEAGAPVNVGQQGGFTPLMEAVLHDDIEIAGLLLARGADPKAQNDAGKSAIGLAADRNNAAMLKLLKGVKT